MGCVGSAPRSNKPILEEGEFTFVPDENKVEDFWKLWKQLKEMGTGASGRVASVQKRDNPSGEKFACKEMIRDDEWNPRLFQTEYDILNRLKHPNILRYVDAWVDRQNFYVLNELCEGGELFDKIHKHRKFKEKDAARILNDIIGAIGFCHKQ